MLSSGRGLRVLRALNTYTKDQPDHFDAHNIFNKIDITSLANGVMKGSFTVDKSMCNVAGFTHGGFIASTFDAATIYAQLSVPDSRLAWTINLNLIFLNSSKIGDKVTLETAVLKTGRYPMMETVMRSETGSILAKGVASLVNGNDQHQKLLKELIHFDTNEN